MKTPMNTGADLRKWRTESRLSQMQLADAIGYSSGRISHIETENAVLSNRIKSLIADYDNTLHPQPDRFSVAWASLMSYRNLFPKEMDILEEGLLAALDIDISSYEINTLQKYFAIVGSTIASLSRLKNPSERDMSSLKGKIQQSTSAILREVAVYLHMRLK